MTAGGTILARGWGHVRDGMTDAVIEAGVSLGRVGEQ